MARVNEFERLAAAAAAERRAAVLVRGKVTIYRGEIAKMIEAGTAAGADWRSYREGFSALYYRLLRKMTLESVASLVDALLALAAEVVKSLEKLLETQILDGNDRQSGLHTENSRLETSIELEPVCGNGHGGRTERALPLTLVRQACPDILLYDRGGIVSWRDLISTAQLVHAMLGVSPSAWEDAKTAMGAENTEAVVAGIRQRAEAIKSPGGYLRGLTEKSRAGRFSPWPMVPVLLRA